MSLEAIETITALEETMRAEKADAQAQGQLLPSWRAAQEKEKELLIQAEQRAAGRGEEIARTAQAQSEALRHQAEKNLSKAVEFIVERVVRN